MNLRRTISLSLVLAVAALAPAAALAKNGADDSPNTLDDNGGQRLDDNNRDTTTQRGKRVRGRCSAGATSKLKVKPNSMRACALAPVAGLLNSTSTVLSVPSPFFFTT